MRTIDQANYALNRTCENRRIYAEQQVAAFYADLLKAQRGFWTARTFAGEDAFLRMQDKAERDLAEAHAKLDAIHLGVRSVDICRTSGTVGRAPYAGTVTCGLCGKSFDTDSDVIPIHHNL